MNITHTSTPSLRSTASFHELLSNEKLLQQAIAGLLARMPNVESVQILHGASEFGKDIVFKWSGAFEESLPCACVVKKDRVLGRVNSNQSARTIFHQIEQAFDTPYITESGEPILIQRVYVITPYEVAQSAMHSISGALKPRSGQIIFISGHELVRLFQKFWPDFLADEASAIKKYLDSAASRLNDNPELSRVGMLYDIQSPVISTDVFYVDLSFQVQLSDFAFDTPISSLLPSVQEVRLEDYWFEDHSKLLRSRYQELDGVLAYLEECGFSLNDDHATHRTLKELEQRFLKILPDAWFRYAMENCSHDYGKRPNLPKGARIGLARRGELEPLCREMQLRLNQLLAPTENALTELSEAAALLDKQKVTGDALLSSPTFKQAMHVENSIRFVPFDKVSRRPRLVRELTPDLLNNCPESLLITGPAGSGKTCFCRWNALRDIRLFKEGKSQTIPVYIALNCTNLLGIHTLLDLIASAARASAFLDESALHLFKDGKRNLRVYLDGLDEVYDDMLRRQVADIIHKGINENQRIQVILTSRDYVGGSWLNWITRASLMNISRDQFRDLALKWFANDEMRAAKFIDELNRTPEIQEITTTPLMATLTILVYRQTGRLPETRNRLYEVFVDLLSGGWDLAKGIIRKSHFSRDSKLKVLSSLAYTAHKKGLRTFPKTEVLYVIEDEYGKLGPERTGHIIDEMLRDGILSSQGTLFQFRHLSFQEYLAARYCLYRPRDVQIKYAVKAFADGDGWWREVVRFYITMIGGRNDFVSWLNTFRRDDAKKKLIKFFDEAARDVFLNSD